MIRAVLDTNVLVSAVLNNGHPRQIVDRFGAGRFTLLVPPHVWSEFERTVSRASVRTRLRYDAMSVTALIRNARCTISESPSPSATATHPEDDLVLAQTLGCGASVLVTGDRALVRIQAFDGVTVLTPRDFLELLDSE